MKFELVKNVLTLKVDMITTLTIAVLLLFLGYAIRKKVKFFERFCIPAPVIGGLLFSLTAFILRQNNVIAFSMDTTFQSPFMIAFFTTVGLGASFGLVKRGGKPLVIYWLLCSFLAIAQNVIGVSFAKLVGIHPVLGVMAGAVSMEGGHGAAAAFGPTAETLGVAGATAVAISAATFGLISGGLLGGPLAKKLIDQYDLKPLTTDKYDTFEEMAEMTETQLNANIVMVQIAVITVCMAVGTMIGAWFSKLTGFALPGYVGAMFTAVILRNINDKIKLVNINYYAIDIMGSVSLGIFLSMALMNLKLWELMGLALPMFVILIAQVAFIYLFARYVCFPLLGRNFDAAVMVSGLVGHGLGATPNAMANMGAVTEKYGPSEKAFLIVPIVGAFLIDLVGIPNIVWFINFFTK